LTRLAVEGSKDELPQGRMDAERAGRG
jgi:hypothetical protein